MEARTMKTILLALIPLLLFTPPLHAEQKKIQIIIDDDGDVEASEVEHKEEAKKEATKKDADGNGKEDFTFGPDFCDFDITFPEAPAVAQKCVNDQCYEVNSYTMVYDLQTTVDVSVTCNPSTPADYKRYSEAVMKTALYGMIDNRNLKTHDIKFSQREKTKTAALTGEGITGSEEKIYTGQIWVGPNSVFTIQAELVGRAHAVADKSFGDILSSITEKEGKQLPKPKKAPSVPKQNNQ